MNTPHTNLAKTVHWTFILLYAYGIFKQIDDLSQLEDTELLIFEVIFASVFLLIVLLRYYYMRKFETFQGAQVPIHQVHKFFAKTIHSLMYICLILLPVTGLLIAGLFAQGVKEGILIDSVTELHGFSADLSYVLIAIHVAAAVYSRIKGEGVWTSMVPVLKESKPAEHSLVSKITSIENRIFDRIEEFMSKKSDE